MSTPETAPAETAAVKATAWVAARLAAPTEALEIQTVEIPAPGPNEVRIAVSAFCLDFNDIDTIYGRYFLLKFEPPFVPGMAAAGVVEAAGPGAEALLGKRVVGTHGRRERFVRVDGAARCFERATAAELAQLHRRCRDVLPVPARLAGDPDPGPRAGRRRGARACRGRRHRVGRRPAGQGVRCHRHRHRGHRREGEALLRARRRLRRQLLHGRLRRLRQRRHQRPRSRHRLRHHRRAGHPGHVPGRWPSTAAT